MSSAFERSLRGASTTSSSFSSSSHKPAKKKSVRWNDGDALSAGGAGESGGVLRSSSSACANAAGGALGAILEAQSIDHLRVPAKPSASSTRVMDSAAHHHGSGSGGGGGLLASGRKRPGGGGGGGGEQRGIQMGAVRVRTPAKPKRARSELASYNAPGGGGGGAVGGATVGTGTGATHNFLRRGTGTACAASAAVASPKRSPPGAAGAAATRRPRSPLNPAGSASGGGGGGSRLSPSLHRSRSPRATPPRSPFAAARFTTTPMASGARSGQRQRRLSSSQALRNVAGGDDDDDDAEATFLEDDDGEGSDFLGASGASDRAEEAEQEQEHQQHDEFKAMSSADGPSPMSALSNTLSSIGLAAGGGISGGKPPRSPRAGRGSPGSEFFGGGGERGSSRASPRSSPKVAGVRTGTPALEITGGGVEGLADGMVEEAGEDEEEFLALGSDGVARQSLDSRLAAAAYASSGRAAAAARASVDNLHNNNNNNGSSTTTTTTSNHTNKNASPSSLSPFTKNTTVRRTSTSTVHVNGEPTSVVSEEMSEEVSSFTVTSAACGCQHELGCSIGAFGGQLPAGENGTSIEVSDRLKELQGRTSMLEQEKVNLTLALAPLEERLQAKERAWNSERRELMVRSEANLRSTRVAEDRCRELERRKSEMEEERHSLEAELRRLRGEIEQRESKTAESFWQRTVAADREKTRLENALDQAEARVVTLNKEKCELEAGLLPIQSENSSLKFRLIESEKVASRVLTAEEGLRFSETQLEVLKSELAATSAQLTAVQTELAHQKAGARKQLEEKERKAGDDVFNLRKEMQRLQETICSQADRVVAASMSEQVAPPTGGDSNGGGGGGVEAMVVAQAPTESVASVADAALSSEAARIRQQELTSLRSQLEASLERTQLLEKQVEEGEEERRRMHNTILDLAGSVRVYVRARPFLKSDGEGAAEEGATVVRCGADASSIAVLPPDAPNRGISCAFDHVFGGHASQEDVFKEVSGFVQSALDGYKVCLFSYGQTGSGKTHTMTGSGNGMMRGIVPRAVEHILARVGELQDGPWKYNVQASFLEIYNEELRDLLVGHGSTSAGIASTGKLSIKKSAGGGTEVAGLTKYDIDTGDQNQGLLELDEIMRAAQRTRSVACTAMNAESSRSHSVFTLWLTGVDASTGTTLRGVLHLVDLAGSERLDRSGVGNDAQRLRETQAINKSLSCLADVFSALAAKASHVPYRNSKLTYLMQDCLSGDGKALMFVNLSPTAASANETVCSLRFANQVNQVQLGKATRQLSLSKPAGSSSSSSSSSSSRVSSGGARGPNSPPRTQGSRLTRASGSAASTAPPSPRSSQGGSFGFGRTSAGGGGKASAAAANNAGGRTSTAGAVRRASRLSSSSSTASPPPTAGVKPRMGVRGSKRTSLTGSGGPGGSSARARGTSAASRGGIGGGGGAPTGGGVGARAGGRTSVSGSRLPRLSAGRSRGSGEGLRGGEEGGRRTSGSTRPSSAISKSLPPSPKPTAAEKRLRLSSENKRQA